MNAIPATILTENKVTALPRRLLTHCSRKTPKEYLANSADPDQTPQNAASDQGLHCLQILQPFFSSNI